MAEMHVLANFRDYIELIIIFHPDRTGKIINFGKKEKLKYKKKNRKFVKTVKFK